MKHLLLLAFLFCSASLSAQSLIVTSEGQPITGYDVTITDGGIFYRAAESKFNSEALPPWQTSETYNPSGQAFPRETRAEFHGSSSPGLTYALPPVSL